MISNQIAAQEDSARETQAQRDEDVVYARDFAAIVEALRNEYRDRVMRGRGRWAAAMISRACGPADNNDYSFFVSQWGFPALLRALAKAIELEAK